jgi:hypothetical protein
MMRLIGAEWYKLRKSNFVWILLVGPAMAFLVGAGISTANQEIVGMNEWLSPLFAMNLIYGLLFLPLVTGVYAGLICRYEHQSGGWKQLLAMPVSRGQVFVAKYALTLILIFVMQIVYLAAVYGVGIARGFTEPFPLEIVWKCALGGWVATFPLVALQLWLSILWKNFAAPFAVNVVFTLPSILAINSDRFGPYYPWAQPFSMMYIGGSQDDVFFVPWELLLTVVGGSFVLFFLVGYVYFQRKAV